jgi:hypothetical protein
MDPHKTEETLHSYMRKHFEKVSKNKARQLAEQAGVFREDVTAEMRECAQSGDRRELL